MNSCPTVLWSRRRDMKGEERVIYLDNNATTRTAPEAVAAMLP